MSSNEYYPNYGYVGAPANYNGTGANGGDSGMFPSLRVFEYQIVPPQFVHSACLSYLNCQLPHNAKT